MYEWKELGNTLGITLKGAGVMPKKKNEGAVDPENLKPEDRMKFEIASELGLADKVVSGGWRCLTAKESGRIGGLITKKKREQADLLENDH